MTFSQKQRLPLSLYVTLNAKGTDHGADRCESVFVDLAGLHRSSSCIAALKQEAHLLHASTTAPLGRMLMMGVMVMMMGGGGWGGTLLFSFASTVRVPFCLFRQIRRR